MTCPFCNPTPCNVVTKWGTCKALLDNFPVSEGHMLVVPNLHVSDMLQLTPEEVSDLFNMVQWCMGRIISKSQPDGFNIGINVGKAAGQTIEHLHIHVIPRYKGDVEDPTGGVRNIIPGMGNYLKGEVT